MGNFTVVEGERYGRLTAIKFIRTKGHGNKEWLFKCDCGKDHFAVAYSVKKGFTQSCGCFMKERAVEANTKHGLSKTRIYGIWGDMNKRCSNRNRTDWMNYGGRGITVCDEWRHDFQAFYFWAKNNGYTEDLSIDRKDNNKGYSPENCQWATKKQQNNNTRASRKITAFGETKNLQQWADESKIGHATILFRLKSGWTPEDAVSIVPVIGANQFDKASRLSIKVS